MSSPTSSLTSAVVAINPAAADEKADNNARTSEPEQPTAASEFSCPISEISVSSGGGNPNANAGSSGGPPDVAEPLLLPNDEVAEMKIPVEGMKMNGINEIKMAR